jgi:hypothetical protein
MKSAHATQCQFNDAWDEYIAFPLNLYRQVIVLEITENNMYSTSVLRPSLRTPHLRLLATLD